VCAKPFAERGGRLLQGSVSCSAYRGAAGRQRTGGCAYSRSL